jgi:lysophospholipase L1-like esterase
VSWAAVVVVAAAVAVTIVSGYLLTSWPPEPPSTAEPLPNADPAPAASSLDGEPLFVVLGDSFTATDEANAQAAWPTLLAERLQWEVETDAVAGTGYASDAEGQSQRFPLRVPALLDEDGDVIIVAGGVDDLGAYPMQQIVTGAEEVVITLAEETDPQTQVVVVSPFSNGTPGPLTNELNAELRRIANEQGVAYVDATQWLVGEGLFTDPSTPSGKGQRRIAKRMERELERLGIAEATAEPAG